MQLVLNKYLKNSSGIKQLDGIIEYPLYLTLMKKIIYILHKLHTGVAIVAKCSPKFILPAFSPVLPSLPH